MIYKMRVWDRERLMMFDLIKADYAKKLVTYKDKEELIEKDLSAVTIIEWSGIRDKDSLDIYFGDIIILRGASIEYMNRFIDKEGNNEFRVIAEKSKQFYELLSIADEVELIGDAFNNPMLVRNI